MHRPSTPPGPDVAVTLQLLFMAAFFVGIILWGNKKAREREQAWQRVAAARGLTYHPGSFTRSPRLAGRIGDVHVNVKQISRQHGKSSTTYTVVDATVPSAVPAGLHLAREDFGDAIMKMLGGQDIQLGDPLLDQRLRVRGSDEQAIRALLQQPRVAQALTHLVGAGRYSRVHHGEVVLEETGHAIHSLPKLVDGAVELAVALGGGTRAPWDALGQTLGFPVHQLNDEFAMEGARDGMGVAVRAGWSFGFGTVAGISDAPGVPDLPGARISVKVTLPSGLPAGLLLRLAPRESEDRGIRLPDPVLDGMIEAFGDRAEEVRALLSAPVSSGDLHGDLLAVLHAWPGSEVTTDAVVLHASGVQPHEGERLVDDAVRLARSLAEASRHIRATTQDARDAARARAAEISARLKGGGGTG